MNHAPRPSNGFLEFDTRSAAETKALAEALAPVLVPGDVLVLAGDLGAGKTTFVQGLALGLGIAERVTSPTFVLMKEYLGGRFPLMHMDVYRMNHVQEVIDLGYDEFLDPSYVVVVEWGDMVEPLLPQAHLKIEIKHHEGSQRTVAFSGKGHGWQARLETMKDSADEALSHTRNADPDQYGSHYDPGDPTSSESN